MFPGVSHVMHVCKPTFNTHNNATQAQEEQEHEGIPMVSTCCASNHQAGVIDQGEAYNVFR